MKFRCWCSVPAFSLQTLCSAFLPKEKKVESLSHLLREHCGICGWSFVNLEVVEAQHVLNISAGYLLLHSVLCSCWGSLLDVHSKGEHQVLDSLHLLPHDVFRDVFVAFFFWSGAGSHEQRGADFAWHLYNPCLQSQIHWNVRLQLCFLEVITLQVHLLLKLCECLIVSSVATIVYECDFEDGTTFDE